MKAFIKKVTATALSALLLLAGASPLSINRAYAQEEFLPIRAIFETVGADVDWQSGQVVITFDNGSYWTITPGESTAQLNSQEFALNTPVMIADNRAMISTQDAALLLEPTGAFPQTVFATMTTAVQLMQAMGVTGITMAIVDAETGFTWTQGLGYADSINSQRVNNDTLFQIGSISKPFTAVAIMQLVEQGIIDLDEPIITYIPEFSLLPNPILGGNSDNITTRMLLSNTSGIVTNWNYAFFTTGYEHYQGNMNSLLNWLPTRHMSFSEGDVYEYANVGWTLLGILVARVTGHTNYFEGFDQYTQENIFSPLGMDRSTFVLSPQMTNFARPYMAIGMQDTMTSVPALSAGSMFSSANDMARFMHAILGDGTVDGARLLQPETIAYMLQSHTPAGGVPYGLGFAHSISPDGFSAVGHSGGTIHYFSNMIFNTETNLGVFVSTNTEAGAMLAPALTNIMLQSAIMEKTGTVPRIEMPDTGINQLFDPSATPIALSDEELKEIYEQFSGLYYFNHIGLFTLELIDGHLVWTGPGEDDVLTPLSDGSFAGVMSRELFTKTGDVATVISISPVGIITGARINAQDLTAPEDFAQWVGTYVFMPQLANEVLQLGPLTIALNNGMPTVTLPTRILGYSELVLTQQGDVWFFNNMPIIFAMDDYGVATIDLHGGLFVRQ